jgi:hypothetical protein
VPDVADKSPAGAAPELILCGGDEVDRLWLTCLSATDAWGECAVDDKSNSTANNTTLLIKLAHSEPIRARTQFGLQTLST